MTLRVERLYVTPYAYKQTLFLFAFTSYSTEDNLTRLQHYSDDSRDEMQAAILFLGGII